MAHALIKKKKKKAERDSAIIINPNDEQFILISSQTALSSNDSISISRPLNDSTIGSIRRANFNLSLTDDKTSIERNKHYDGIALLSRHNKKSFNYDNVECDDYDISGLKYPSPSVSIFTGGYASREGCFVVGCNNKKRRVCYFGGCLDRNNTRIQMHGFPTTVAKALHSICTAYPELVPSTSVTATNEYDETEEFPIYGQFNNSNSTYLNIEINNQIFENLNVTTSDYVVIRVELSKVPDGTCSQRVISVLQK